MNTNPKYSSWIDDEKNIFFKEYFGKITFEDVVKTWDLLLENNQMPENIKGIVLNYLQAEMDMGPEAAEKIVKYYGNHPEAFIGKRIAIVTERPKDIIVPVLMREEVKEFEVRPFSTIDAACQWISR